MGLSAVVALSAVVGAGASAPRFVKIKDKGFVDGSTGAPVVMWGPNIVVKGPPWLPSTSGDAMCADLHDAACSAAGTCATCTTFNEHDVAHIKSMGWNAIRLSVVWAGAQPRDEDALDGAFLTRFHAILNLTDTANISVLLDNHGDMVGSANCGNGVPMWVSQKASPDLIGKQLTTGYPYKLVPSSIQDLKVEDVNGWNVCGDDAAKWAKYAGDPNYNLLNECCIAMNGGSNQPGLAWSDLAQDTMRYILDAGEGRDAFLRFWRLVAEAVADHPSAFGFELMNEPMSIHRPSMFETWRAAAETIVAVIPDASVALADMGEGAILPAWLSESIFGSGLAIWPSTVDWIKKSTNVFYAWHYYGDPSDPADAVKNVLAIADDWNVPTFLTEFDRCDIWTDALAASISISYWHYSIYCDTGPQFGNKTVPDDTFGACILGWGACGPNKTCPDPAIAHR